jgi:hypothetical protein
MVSTNMSRDVAGAIYAKKLREAMAAKGAVDEALIYQMTKEWTDQVFGPAPNAVKTPPPLPGFPQGKDDAYAPAPYSAGLGIPQVTNPIRDSSPMGKDDAYSAKGPPTEHPYSPESSAYPPGVSINSVPPAATAVPTPALRPSPGGGGGATSGFGYDPLPQTSGHTSIVGRSGQESMNPAAAELLAKLMAAQRMA